MLLMYYIFEKCCCVDDNFTQYVSCGISIATNVIPKVKGPEYGTVDRQTVMSGSFRSQSGEQGLCEEYIHSKGKIKYHCEIVPINRSRLYCLTLFDSKWKFYIFQELL